MAINALQTLFDKRAHEMQLHHDVWIVSEKDAGAFFRRLTIRNTGCVFHEVCNPFYKGIKNTTEDRSTLLWDSDCDGVCEISITGKMHYVFVDLKSNFDIQKIHNAFLQDLHTFLKLHTMLSLCEGYDLNNSVIDLVVACKTFKNKAQEDKILDILLEKTALPEDSFEKIFLNDLINGENPKTCSLCDFKTIKDLPFHPDIKHTKVRVHLVLSENYADDSSVYTL